MPGMNPAKAHVHALHSPWSEDDDDKCVFSGTVTIDPSRILGAWDRLSQDTWVLEFQSVPHIMHYALLHILKERGWAK